MLKANKSVGKTWRIQLLVGWLGLDGLLYLGAIMTLVLALTDKTYQSYTYAFTIALVVSWATRMAYGIWLEIRRTRMQTREKALRVNEILQRHGLSEDDVESVARELKNLD